LKSKDDSWLWRQIALTPHGNLRLAWTFLGLLVPGQPWSGVVLAEENEPERNTKKKQTCHMAIRMDSHSGTFLSLL